MLDVPLISLLQSTWPKKEIEISRGSKSCMHIGESLAYKYCCLFNNYHWNNISRERIFELSAFCPRTSHTDSVNLSRIWSEALIGQRDINYKYGPLSYCWQMLDKAEGLKDKFTSSWLILPRNYTVCKEYMHVIIHIWLVGAKFPTEQFQNL